METQPNSKKVDRRAMRSKRLIIEAWRELLLEKDDKEITVSDIVKRADIGRATFYAHFEDKTDLGKYLFNQLMMQIEQEIQAILNESELQDNQYQHFGSQFGTISYRRGQTSLVQIECDKPANGSDDVDSPFSQAIRNAAR